MPTSDSEDFESADEGPNDVISPKKERKKRLSSSNFSENQDSEKSTIKNKFSTTEVCI